jgi:uncharacterized membrane protein
LINLIAIVASIIGLVDAGYLSYSKFNSINLVCSRLIGNCNVVNASKWSVVMGIPTAYLGLLTYLIIFFLLLFGKKIGFLKPYSDRLFFIAAGIGFLFSVYLTYIEAVVLNTFCEWCLVSALMMTILFSISVIKLARRPRQ